MPGSEILRPSTETHLYHLPKLSRNQHIRSYVGTSKIICCLPPPLPLLPPAAAIVACPRHCHHCCLPAPLTMIAATATAAPVPSAIIAATAAYFSAAITTASMFQRFRRPLFFNVSAAVAAAASVSIAIATIVLACRSFGASGGQWQRTP